MYEYDAAYSKTEQFQIAQDGEVAICSAQWAELLSWAYQSSAHPNLTLLL